MRAENRISFILLAVVPLTKQNAPYTIYVRALTNGEWLGAWAPVHARLEWLH